MFQIKFKKSCRVLRRKTLFLPLLILLLSPFECQNRNLLLAAATEETTTPEPEASPGCKAPEIRFNAIRPEETTEQPFASFETTESYHSDEDFTTADVEFVDGINIDLTGHHHATVEKQPAAIVNPYQIDMDGHQQGYGPHAEHEHVVASMVDEEASLTELAADAEATTRRRNSSQNRRENKKRRSGQGRRRRIENENGQSGGSRGGRGSRYKRQIIHYDPDASPETDKWAGSKLAAEGDVYYVHIEDLLKSKAPNQELRLRLHKIKRKKKKMGKYSGNRDDGNQTTVRECFEGGENKAYCRKRTLKKASAANITKSEKRLRSNKNYPKKQQQQQGEEYAKNKSHHRHRGDSHDFAATQWTSSDIASNERLKRNVHTRWRRNKLLYNDEKNENQEQETVINGKSMNSIAKDDDDDNVLQEHQQQQQQRKETNNEEDFEPEQVPVPMAETYDNSTSESLQRVKRKSGKTTGALSRPKGGGDSSSKTTSRKDKGVFDEESGYSPVHPDETDSEEEDEEEEDIDIAQQFTEVSEIRFPGEIGPLGDRRLCKIRCIKGKWVGPLCATNEEDDSGNVKFQPLYKSCHVNRIPPHLLLSYRNISVTPIKSIRGSRRNRTSKSTFISNTAINVGWDLPHGHSLQARCKDLGLYKLLGETRVLCSNGLWAPRMPSCVPTSLLTNFSDDSAPSIRIKINSGSGAFEPSGVLAVLPGSNINMDCMYPRLRGTPEWTWTSWYMQYTTGWSTAHDEKNLRYRLTIKDIQNSDTGTFTCTSPRGLTNSIMIVVATSTCPQLPEPVPPLSLRLEGNKLGQRALYRCPPGYRIDGSSNSTCLASGNWSSPPPTCQAIQCQRLVLEDPHLVLVELNTSAWGRAIFKCQWGFKLSGPPGLECKPTGVWNGPVPSCRAIQCPTPMAPLNGRIGGTSSSLNQRRLTVGALVTFSCNEGHLLVGEPSIICTETGFWSHPPPFCKSQCPYPGDPPNGLIAPLKFNYDSGDYLTVQCRPGFVQYSENGPPERPKCMPDGNWSGPVPKCRSYEEV